VRKIALFALALPLAAQDWRPAPPSPDQIKLVQEHEAMERRAQHLEIVPKSFQPSVGAKPLAKDPRTEEQKRADAQLLEQYFRLKPTGKLVRVEFPDGMVLYVPEVK
jgi:hypothetical protein